MGLKLERDVNEPCPLEISCCQLFLHWMRKTLNLTRNLNKEKSFLLVATRDGAHSWGALPCASTSFTIQPGALHFLRLLSKPISDPTECVWIRQTCQLTDAVDVDLCLCFDFTFAVCDSSSTKYYWTDRGIVEWPVCDPTVHAHECTASYLRIKCIYILSYGAAKHKKYRSMGKMRFAILSAYKTLKR